MSGFIKYIESNSKKTSNKQETEAADRWQTITEFRIYNISRDD